MSEERIKPLEDIGFEWSLQKDLNEAWEDRFNELVAYKEKNGNCNAPQKCSLGKWVIRQRALYKRGEMPETRISELDGIGF